MTVTTINPPGTFCWIELATTDGPRAREFYSKLFGWDVKDTPMGPDFTYYMFQVDGLDVAAMYQLMPDQLKRSIPPHWLSYVAVSSADEASARAASLGGTVITAPFDVGTHGRMAMIADPQGAMFAMWQARDNDGIGKRGEPGSLVWNELASTDITAGAAFYSKLFDWNTKIMNMPGMDYTIFEREGQAIGVGGGMQITPETPMPPNWLPYFAVSDCDGSAALAATLGATVLMPPMDIPGTGRFAVLRDPSGAAFAILKTLPMP
jgi:predicted enzyme related to lactoylglutathione lyase